MLDKQVDTWARKQVRDQIIDCVGGGVLHMEMVNVWLHRSRNHLFCLHVSPEKGLRVTRMSYEAQEGEQTDREVEETSGQRLGKAT